MTDTLPRLLRLQACDQRIQQATHTINTLRQSLATLQEEGQSRAQDLQAWRDKSKEAKQTRGTLTSLLDQVAVIEEELRIVRDERAVLAAGIAPFLLQEYERIFSRRGEVAVVALADETCQGCHMHLPPQMCMNLQRHPRLTFCPHCHRILFIPLGTSLSVVEPCSATDNANGRRTPQPQGRPKTRARTSKKPSRAELPPASPVQA